MPLYSLSPVHIVLIPIHRTMICAECGARVTEPVPSWIESGDNDSGDVYHIEIDLLCQVCAEMRRMSEGDKE